MFPSNLMVPQVGQRGSKLSPRLWSRLIEEGLSADGSAPGDLLIEDFVSSPSLTSSGACNDLYFFSESSATVKQNADSGKSAVELATGATANKNATLISNGNTGNLGSISDSAGSDKLTIFEAHVKLADVADSSAFIGLAAPGSAAASKPLSGTDHALADQAAIGFVVLEDDPDALKFVYRHAGVAAVTVLTYASNLVADQYYNLGFVYDPSAPASEKIKIYVDNVEQASKVSASDIAAASFPDGDALAACVSVRSSASAAEKLYVDLLAYYQAG